MTGAVPVLFFLKKKTQESIKADREQESGSTDLDSPQVSPLSLNENQKAIVSLVLHTLYNFVENTEYYHPLRLVVSGTAGTVVCHQVSPEVSAASVWSQ